MAPDNESVFERMYRHINILLALNTSEQMLTWQYILIVYCQLEAHALELLRLHQGKDVETFWKGWLPALNRAAEELRKQQLAPPETIEILKKVAELRNSVAHKQLLYGMTTYAQYDNAPIFDREYLEKYLRHPDVHFSGVNEVTLEQFLEDVHHAIMALKQARTLIQRH